MRLICLALAATVAAAPAFAQTVSPVTVFSGEAPKVVATYPAQDQTVAPGVLVLKVTFNQKMLLNGFDYGPAPGGEPLECVQTPRLLNDEKTFVLLCRAWPGKTYGVTLNASEKRGFANRGELRAQSATLTFTTLSGEPNRTVAAGLKAAGLEPTDTPIQETANAVLPASTAAKAPAY
ncbi:hypothetical protein [Phenylobacterium immobile]|uniref:hypothetical protein n=1 Tax=Phenylobacterium immobile TaxID=21 RepID=UPI000AD475E0|nr:hypothetical protein [Phenylobacterium immobile]